MTKRRAAVGIQWKTFWAVVAPFISAVWVAVWLVTGSPVWIAGLATALLAATAAFGARLLVRISPMFARLSVAAKSRVVGWLVAAVTVYAAWSTLAVSVPDLWPVWALVLPALGGSTWVMARAHEYLLRYAPPPARPAAAVALTTGGHAQLALAAEDLSGPRDGEPHLAWLLRLAVRRAGLEWLRISNPQMVGPADAPFGARVEAWAPIELRRVVNGKVRVEQAPRLDDHDARRIALALRDITRRDIAPDWVNIGEDPNRVGVYTIQANTEDVMKRIRPYKERAEDLVDAAGRPRWRRIAEPCNALWGMDGMPIGVDVARHAWILGATTGGKSAYIHREWADVTRCEDALIWVAGTRKLYDLVGPWLEPYLGQDVRPPLDWVRADAEGVLQMLIAAMEIARWRQDQPFSARHGFKKILFYIDEGSFALNTKVKAYYDGAEVTAGDMYAECTQAVASAGIYLVVATQRGVHHAFGDKGGDASANIGREIVLMSGDEQEAGRVTGNYKLPPLRHRGECYARLGDSDPVRAKIEYVQTSDPSKPVLHDGPRVDEISWNRRYHQRDLDAGSAQAAGTAYAGRHQLVTDDYLADLRGARTRSGAKTQASTPERDADQAMASAVASIFSRLGGKPATAPPAPAAVEAPAAEAVEPTPMAGYRTRADRVEAAVRQIWRTSSAPASPRDILAALHEGGDTAATPQLVSNALTQLGQQVRVVRPQNPDGRPATGQYLPPEAATTTVTASNA
ncbi:hypothetical protein [Micromonospora sp. RL09-050-HVF-A]|uniref:hypothetical protein n=1 Tax=Micromonospora sp. RL09-050-HVF-A TaxID=1703433 RepID=UPI001C5F8C31|nr:hypothetical protein [Micromonospora sp. RL09-050-HVF-A]MBW4700345.1 hypothetical protein [Micromonospora sp. RL09-050-HVF-A]